MRPRLILQSSSTMTFTAHRNRQPPLVAQEITRLTIQLFSDWKSPRPFKRVPSVFRDIAPANQTFQAPDKANAFFVAGFLFDMRDDNADYAAITLGHYMLGGGFLSSRLAARIRQKEGLSYGVGSGIFVSAVDHYGRFTASRSTPPRTSTNSTRPSKKRTRGCSTTASPRARPRVTHPATSHTVTSAP